MGDDWRERASAAMDKYACGDESAFEGLYDDLAPRLHAFLCRRVRNPTLAEDLLQQSFERMHASRRHFAAGSDVVPWAFAITRRLLIDWYRKYGRSRSCDHHADTELLPSHDPSPAAVASKRHLLRRVERELECVRSTNRIAFELVKLDGISIEDAAQMLGTTVMGVKLRVHRTLQALQEKLGPDVREELSEWA
jgi:RNA polymerase sigma-70 factor (ECF subfamily)